MLEQCESKAAKCATCMDLLEKMYYIFVGDNSLKALKRRCFLDDGDKLSRQQSFNLFVHLTAHIFLAPDLLPHHFKVRGWTPHVLSHCLCEDQKFEDEQHLADDIAKKDEAEAQPTKRLRDDMLDFLKPRQ